MYSSLRFTTPFMAYHDNCNHDDVVKSEHFKVLLAICAGYSPVTGEFPTQRPVTQSFEVFFDIRPNKRLCKQSWGWWFETLSRPLWRHCNEQPIRGFVQLKYTIEKNIIVNSSRTSEIFMSPSVVNKKACRIFSVNLLSEHALSFNWTHGNKFRWKFNLNTISIQES